MQDRGKEGQPDGPTKEVTQEGELAAQTEKLNGILRSIRTSRARKSLLRPSKKPEKQHFNCQKSSID